ncbi:MAG TPA: tetratricopeptide repeat protein [Thermoanaerobaculia bacterium]|nr:tetratricopeptide repeat protein [Thermoanaerobaculia bacterium]
MEDHPTPESLQELVRGGLPAERTRAVVAHLVQGCGRCLAVVVSRYQALVGLPRVEHPLTPEQDAGYDAAIDRAFAAVRAFVARARPAAAGGEPAAMASPDSLRLDTLLAQSSAARYQSPERMIELAEEATRVAASLTSPGPGLHTPRQIADLQCRAWAELGNAYRVADDLGGAEDALGRAAELFTRGTGDESLRARLFDLLASFYGARRRFEMARTALEVALGIYRRQGDGQLAGRALLKLGTYTGYAGRPEEAIRLTREGLARLDEERDPGLVFVAVHNLARWLTDCGQFREARKLLWQNRARHEHAGGDLNLLKIRWLEGEINAGLGELERAENAFRAVHEGFAEAGLRYTAAVAALDLATVWLRQGRDAEARHLALEAAQVFLVLRIHREALGAVLILQKALEVSQASAALLESVARFLRRAEDDPTARFEPKA